MNSKSEMEALWHDFVVIDRVDRAIKIIIVIGAAIIIAALVGAAAVFARIFR